MLMIIYRPLISHEVLKDPKLIWQRHWRHNRGSPWIGGQKFTSCRAFLGAAESGSMCGQYRREKTRAMSHPTGDIPMYCRFVAGKHVFGHIFFGKKWYPLVMSNIAIENGPVEIVDEPSIAWWFSIVFPMSTISIVSQLHFSMQLCLSWYPAGSHRSPPSKILSVRGSSTWHVPSGKHTENDGKST